MEDYLKTEEDFNIEELMELEEWYKNLDQI